MNFRGKFGDKSTGIAAGAAVLTMALAGGTIWTLKAKSERDISGAWRGSAAGFSVALDLKKSGTGYGKLGPIPEQPLAWRVDENKVILCLGKTSGGASSREAASEMNVIGTLASDRESMTVDLGITQTTLYRMAQ